MINFCITNQPKLVNGNWTHKKRLKHGIWVYYDSGVEIINLPKYWIVFCGILWEGKVTDFIDSAKQNGTFYAIVIDKKSGEMKVINDFMDSFHLTYHVSGRHFVVTNEIKVYGPSFKINQQWVNWAKEGAGVMDAPLKPHPELRDQEKENITPLKGVQYLGASDVLTLQAWDDFDCCPTPTISHSCHPYFAYNQDIGKSFFEKPLHDYKSALATAKQIISENCQRIQEKYGDKLIHFCSTGVDSLTLQRYLNDVPRYGLYCKKFNQYNELEVLFKKLYHEHKGTLHYFNSEGIHDTLDSQLTKIQKTISYTPHHLMFMCMRDIYKLDDRVIIHGTRGGQIFQHIRHYVIRHAVHRWGMTDAQQIWNRCLPHYGFGGPGGPTGFTSKQSRINEIDKYVSTNPYPNFETAITAPIYFKRLPSTGSNYMPNQLMIDPYGDLRLWKLLPSSDVQTQEASMLDAQLQKDMISSKFLPYLNPYKVGVDWFYDDYLNNNKFRKKMINSLLKNLQKL